MSRLEKLAEQTNFLLEMQKKAQKETNEVFSTLLDFLNEKVKSYSDDAERKALVEEISDILSGHAQQFTDEVQEDIEFLGEQAEALNQIKKIEDPEKTKEMLASMIEESEELPETEEFKKNVSEEYMLSKKNLLDMVEDIKASIEEGELKQVKLFLEALLSEQDNELENISEEELEHYKEFMGCDDEKCAEGSCENCPASNGENVFSPAHPEHKKDEKK